LLVGRDTSAGRDGWDKHHGWKVIEKKWSDGWSVIVWGESESWWARVHCHFSVTHLWLQ
jgi:hypothetical protein